MNRSNGSPADAIARPATDRETALRIMAARFGAPEDRGPPRRAGVFALAEFQEDAVRRAERILAVRRGVLVADSVGSGKTYIALALVERALSRGERVLVTTPAALRAEWTAPLQRLRRALGIRDVYGLPPPRAAPLDGAAGGPAPPRHGFLGWLSHTRLSRGTYPARRLDGLDLLVVDEAHAFRSPRTRRYRALAALCRGARVVLLTATPVNNALSDLYFQLRLFAGDGAFGDVGVPDLREAFHAAGNAGDGPAPAIQAVLRAVMIRRTRPFLRERYGGGRGLLAFPERAPPVAVRYALDRAYAGFFPDVEQLIESLTLAPMRLVGYRAGSGAGPDGAGAVELVRIGLLKRLESSIAAFRASLTRQARFYRAFLDALDGGRLLVPAEHRALYDGGDGDVTQLVLEGVALRPFPALLDRRRLRADAVRDLAAIRGLRERLATVGPQADPKLRRLEELLDGELRGEKVVVFTEFRDTARHLWRALLHRGGVALVDGDGAFAGTAACGRRTAIERFAPRANRVAEPPLRERVSVLIATDVLAEGLNLQDAAHVISYDLPWNPVRLIQRIGRVDRIGSAHDVVRSYHFLPDSGLERVLRLLRRLRGKLAAIGRSVGAEAAVLGGDGAAADPGPLVDRLVAGDPDALDALEREVAAPFEAEERLRAAFIAVRGADTADRPGSIAGRGRGLAPVPPTAPVAPTALVLPTAPTTATGPTAPVRPTAPSALAAVVAMPPRTPRRFLLAYAIDGRPLWLILQPETGVVLEDDAIAAEILLRALDAGPAAGSAAASPAPSAAVSDREAAATAPAASPTARPTAVPSVTPTEAPAPTGIATSAVIQTVAERDISRAVAAAKPAVEARRARAVAPEPLPGGAAGARAARRLLAALRAVPGGPDPDLCRRADRLLSVLARRHDAGTDDAIRRALEVSSSDPAPADALVAALERAVPIAAGGRGRDAGKVEPAAPVPVPRAARIELVGVLEARPVA